jgi:uncharacterized protein YoxC
LGKQTKVDTLPEQPIQLQDVNLEQMDTIQMEVKGLRHAVRELKGQTEENRPTQDNLIHNIILYILALSILVFMIFYLIKKFLVKKNCNNINNIEVEMASNPKKDNHPLFQ